MLGSRSVPGCASAPSTHKVVQSRPTRHRGRVVQVSEAATAQQEVAPPAITWGSCSAQGPRPTMEDELCLQVDCKDGFTFAGTPGAEL